MMLALLLILLAPLLGGLPRGSSQGLDSSGGLWASEACDGARLAQFRRQLAEAVTYTSEGGPAVSQHQQQQQEVQAAGFPPLHDDPCLPDADELEGIVHIASAPPAYRAPVPTVRDQGGCATSAGHGVAACAEASLAAFTATSPKAHSFNGRSLHYCAPTGRECDDSWTVEAAVTAVSCIAT